MDITKRVLKLHDMGYSQRAITLEVYGKDSLRHRVRKIIEESERPYTPRILLFDIETSPAVSYHWGRYRCNIGVNQTISRPYIITYAAKWLGDDQVFSDMLPLHELYQDEPANDLHLTRALWNLFDEADIVIGHYAKGFDVPQTYTRFAIHGLPEPSPFKIIDTKEIASRHFKFETNQLDEIADHLGVGRKIKTDFSLWRGCVENDLDSWDQMLIYNEQDVTVLEDVYMKLRPYAKNLPNISLYYSGEVPRCMVCGSDNLTLLDKHAYTALSKFESYRCECGHVQRARQNQFTKERMKSNHANVTQR